MGTMSLTANLIKAGLGLTATRGLHRATYASRQRSLYTFHQWLHVQGETLCPFHRQLMGYSVTHQRFYSSVAVPHDVTRNHNGQKNVDLPTNDSRDGQFIPDRTIGLTKAEQRKLLRRPPEHLEESRVLKVAIIGAPNAGKSTLANMLMGWRFASVSKKVHTTRHRAIGVLTEGDTQIVFLDTPGMISPGKRRRHRLEMSLLTDPHSVLYDADLVAVIVDVSNIWHRTKIDEEVLKALHLHRAKPSILVLNKIDQLKNKQELLNITRILTEGIVGGHRNWSTVKPTKKTVDIDSLFEKMDSEKVNCKFQEPHDSNSSLNGNSSDSDNQPDHDLLSKGHGDVLSSRDLENDLDTMMTSNGREMAESALEMLEIANTVEEAVEESSEMNKKTYVGEIATGDGTMIEVHGTSEEELNKFLAGEKINVGDRDKNPDAVVRTELLSETPTRGQQQQPDLRDGEVWREYYRRIQEAETQVGDKRGWGNFDAVFMLSALEGDGVIDLKNYLLESAVSGPWQFHSSLVTDQDPIEIARMCVWEKMLDHLPEEIPYQIKIKSLPKSPADCVSLNHSFQNPEEGPAIATRFCMDMSCRQRLALWEIDEDHMLRATFELLCDTQRHMFAALGKGGQTAKLIAVEAKQDLMNTFRRELSLRLVVRCKMTTR